MLFTILALVGVAAALLYNYYYNMYNYWTRMGVPHEKPLPIVGNFGGVIGGRLHFRDINQHMYNRFKGKTPFAGMFIFFRRAAFITDLELVKMVLIKDFSTFQDRGLFNNVRDDPLTGHLLTLEGEEWRSLRNKLTPVFTSGKMKQMFTVVVKVGQRLADTMKTTVKAAAVDQGDVELKELCARFTTDVIGTCAFGLECNSLADPQAEFRTKGRMLFEKPRHSPFVQSFIFTNPKLARKFRLKLFPDDVSEFFMKAVQNTVDYRLKNNIKRNDFMGLVMELLAEDQDTARQAGGIDLSQGLTIEQLAAQAFVFFIAGFETSSSTMAFCLYELALHQEIQDRLRKEIESVLEALDGELTYEAMQQMHYLDQVLAETLRKHPILPHLLREANQNFLVPGTRLVIEGGTSVLIPVHSIHYDPEYYPEPERFDPERFTPEAVAARNPFAYLPFGDGPRNCIGLRFGKMQAKIGLIMLVRHFKFDVCKRTEVPLILSTRTFTLNTEQGIHLKVEPV
ncbi:probable cytochrome P450 6a14 [Scaptodrosophila lebanonensis]|uniref:Probable cytochrome P450 6a14 n=1 Tax=Drosophila lebanonensis TaxID=7225 RepID=A0A6J2SWC7_DROLE|nr:probable cytochrome P450 6a14 [Scaptodrosophila lebanonensis]